MADLKVNILMQAADKVSSTFRGITQSTDKMKSAMKEAGRKVRDLEQMSAKLQAFQDLKATARQNANALEVAQAKTKKLADQMQNADKVTGKMRAEFKAASKEVRRLKSTQSETWEETRLLRNELKDAGINTKRFGQEQRKLKADLQATKRAADEQGKALDRAREKTNLLARARSRMQRTMQLQANMAMGGAAGMAVGGGAIALGSRMASAGVGFGEQMSAVGAVARIDKTSQAFASLKQQAQDLGATTSFSASEAASGMQFLAMSGFKANEIMAAMPGMLNLAKAGATDLATTADIASNVLSGFGLKAGDMERLGDVLTATFTRSNVDLSMLGETMKYTAPIAKEFGASVEDVAAMTGLLGNVGIQGSQAGTAMRSLFTRMASPPTEAQKALEKLGVSTKTATGDTRNMVDILSELATKTEKMGSGDRLAVFTDIAGKEAGAAFATLVNQGGAGEVTKFVDILNKSLGETARVANQMGDNAAGDIKGFWSAVEGMNIALTETNDAPLRDLIQSATGVVRGIQAWIKENPKLAGTLVKIAAILAGVIFAGGALATTVAGLLGPFAMARFAMSALGIQAGMLTGGVGMVSKGIAFLGSAAKVVFPMMVGGIRAIGAAMITNPILLIIMAIAGAALLIYNYWEPIKGFFINLWDAITQQFAGTWETIKTLFSFTPIGLIYENWEPIKAFFADLWDGVIKVFDIAWNWITDKLQALASPIKWLSDALGGVFGDAQKTEFKVTAKGPDAAETGNALRAAAAKPVRLAAVAPVAASLAAAPAAAMPGPAPMPMQQGNKYEITIHAAPGMDEKTIAREVTRQIEMRDRANRRPAGGQMYDGID
ncbi:phage tail tape measure protein [Thalassospira marina]|uniref:Phage tail tape measure protein n=1 Tax=Thalassospira marina TaxID=2048283 RepID=A0A2N3KWX6_9PROT|nr:phage tail tape measure protein [Thalassospira marina]PKR55064.1 phage tail tape measure protein [Thalassospira marina]